MTTDIEAPDKSTVSFIVTGFGPFQHSTENPTTVIATKLKDYVRDTNISLLTTLVIETSAEAAQAETDRLKETIAKQKNGNVVVLLHMGVNCMGTRFQLEQCAYNEANFSIPDEKGFQPRHEEVIEACEPALMTKLDVDRILMDLGLDSFVVSTDPGRFVCNYTYYCSLSKFHDCDDVYTLFLHVPPFSVVPEAEQLQVVLHLMDTIRRQFE
ncbi:Pyroglutamyl peptidase [Fragilaria crotonensis]|nr:Pyroglutamyl peptidase [Fragilaria crotonensis]